MEKITFDIELVTPMFMGGADQNGPPEFRAASLKGLLRFWYRAIYPDTLQEEGRLFGNTEFKSPVRLSTSVLKPKPLVANSDKLHDFAYLGYGVVGYDKNAQKNLTTRPGLDCGTELQLTITFNSSLGLADRAKILRSFWALAMFGGLGARSRRGFGSFKVVGFSGIHKELENYIPRWRLISTEEYVKCVQNFLKDVPLSASMPNYSYFSKSSKIIYGPALKSSMMVLKGLNKVFQDYRSYYIDFKTKTRKTSGVAKEDHDLMLDYLHGKIIPKFAPARSAFGLPHNYFFRSQGSKAGVDLMEGGNKGRRASPLFLHVQGLHDGQAMGVVVFLPAQFLPRGKKIRISGGVIQDVDFPNYRAINDFLKILRDKGAHQLL